MSRTLTQACRNLLMCVILAPSLILAPRLALAQAGAVGTPAPDFNLPVFGGGGATMTLSQYSGKVVVLFIIGYG